MKKSLFIIFAIAAFSLNLTTSCKKGSEDPFISFRSRNSRLAGEWKLTKYEGSISRTGTLQQDNYSYTYNFDGTQMTETFAGKIPIVGSNPTLFKDTSWTDTYTYDRIFNVNKDGTYKTTITIRGVNSEVAGDWKWLSGDKSKTLLSADETYYLDGLSNKEMIASRNVRYISYYPLLIQSGSPDLHHYEDIIDLKYNFEKQ